MYTVCRKSSCGFTSDAFSAAVNYYASVIGVIPGTVVGTVSVLIINAVLFLPIIIKNKMIHKNQTYL